MVFQIELCQVVRNAPRWSGLPVMFLTVHNDASTRQQVFTAGADDFVCKPIIEPELVTRILNRLERVQVLQNMTNTQLRYNFLTYEAISPDLISRHAKSFN